jgi:hypothetical protein
MQTNTAEFGREAIPVRDLRGHETSQTLGLAGEGVVERRKHPRHDVDSAARVKVIDPIMSTGPAAVARVLNRSAGGLKVKVPGSVFVGALVQILMPGEILLGEVRYCLANGADFDIGVRVVESW